MRSALSQGKDLLFVVVVVLYDIILLLLPLVFLLLLLLLSLGPSSISLGRLELFAVCSFFGFHYIFSFRPALQVGFLPVL